MGIDFITHVFKTAAQPDPSANTLLQRLQFRALLQFQAKLYAHHTQNSYHRWRTSKEAMAKFSELLYELALAEINIRPAQLPVVQDGESRQAIRYAKIVGGV